MSLFRMIKELIWHSIKKSLEPEKKGLLKELSKEMLQTGLKNRRCRRLGGINSDHIFAEGLSFFDLCHETNVKSAKYLHIHTSRMTMLIALLEQYKYEMLHQL